MKKQILQFLSLTVIAVFTITISNAQITSTTSGGDWNNTSTWIGGTVPGASDNVFIQGKVNVTVGAECLDITIYAGDTLQNNYGSYATLIINANITNNGIIQNQSGTGRNLSLSISGDLINNGIWESYRTYLDGTTQQSITLQTGENFGSIFKISNTTDTIVALTDLHFTQDFNLDNNILNLNNHNIRFTETSYDNYFGNGTVLNPNEFRGTVNITGNIQIEGDLIVTDTLQNYIFSSGYVHLNGSLINNGIIQNQSGAGRNLSLSISGDLINNGIWESYRTYLNGTTDQNIALMDDQPISSDVFFEANFGSSPYQWYYNGAVLDSPDFSGETSKTLSWLVPVSDSWYGTYFCQTGTGNSRNIRVNGGIFSLYFNGVDNYVNCGHDASLNLATTMTIEAWINPAGWGEMTDYGYGRIVDKNRFKLFLNDDASSGYNSQSLIFIIHSGGSSYNLNTPANSISLDSWQHVAATYDGNGNVHVYIDGIEQTLAGTPPPGNIMDNSAEDLFIGESSGQNRAFDGNMDEVRIWGVVLNQLSIRENMYRTLQGNETGLISYWQFNEISGTISYDNVGGNNGTLYSMTNANKTVSNAPIPFYTISDGAWETNSTWATG